MRGRPVQIGCGVLSGVDAVPVVLEISLGNGSGAPRILGLADTSVREAYFRVLGAFSAQGLPPPRDVPTISFTPATLRKTGSGFDLPMALGLAAAAGQFAADPGLAAVGEVSLSGEILPAPGVVSVALAARGRGWPRLLTDQASAALAARVPGVEVFGVATLSDAVRFLRGELAIAPTTPRALRAAATALDLIDIKGHETPKRALAVAAAGRHNLLMVGPPGSGKTALVRRLPGLLPEPSPIEALEILQVQSAAGSGLPRSGRPVRSPHHTSSAASVLGGGSDPRPGEATLAQHGVLFLDELPEFRREVLEGLRQPLEDGVVTIGRARATVRFPADFLLVAAMNPCPCGFLGHATVGCRCTPGMRQRYQGRVSGPLLDRLDLQIEVPALPPEVFHQPVDPRWGSANVRAAVTEATALQRERNPGGIPNGRLVDGALEDAVAPSKSLRSALEHILRVHRLSGRARVRLLRIARTLADLASRDRVDEHDLAQAARLRGYASAR